VWWQSGIPDADARNTHEQSTLLGISGKPSPVFPEVLTRAVDI